MEKKRIEPSAPFLSGMDHRFGGLKARQPFEHPNGKILWIDEMNSGVIRCAYAEISKSGIRVDNVTVFHDSDFKTIIDRFLESVAPPKEDQSHKKTDKFKVDLNPLYGDVINNEKNDLHLLLEELHDAGFSDISATVSLEDYASKGLEAVAIFLFAKKPDTIDLLVSSSTLLPGKSGLKAAIQNILVQVVPLLRPSKSL